MLSRNALVALPILILTSLPAHADGYYRHRHFDRGPSVREMQYACDYGNRRACIDLGREMQQNSDRRWARRQAYMNERREVEAREIARNSFTAVTPFSTIFPRW